MEHLRRADDWTNLLQKVSLVIFPLNPVLYWVEHRLCTERELACDDRVLNSGPGRKAYAICLTHLAEYSILRRSLNLALGAWEKRPELVHRIQRILAQPMLSMGRKPAMVATGSLIVGTLGCALVLAHSPQVVSFVPSEISAHIAQSTVAPHLTEMSRQLGGTPQLVKAVMPQKATTPGIPISKARVRSATLHAHRRERPVQMRQQLFVLTEWTDMGSQSRLFMTVARNQAAQPVVIPASYAVVQTPNGWLILQI
jgi:hypothetical protein